MSVSKVKHQHKVILDFSDQKLTKDNVKRSLREISIEPLFKDVSGHMIGEQLICIDNEIRVGMYKISLLLSPSVSRFTSHKLKEFGDFRIKIFETGNKNAREINLRRDGRFKEQHWAQKNNCGLKDLEEAIHHCKRLDHLKAFI